MAGLLALIETPEAMDGYLLRAQSQSDAKCRAQRCIEAVQEAIRLAGGQRSVPRSRPNLENGHSHNQPRQTITVYCRDLMSSRITPSRFLP